MIRRLIARILGRPEPRRPLPLRYILDEVTDDHDVVLYAVADCLSCTSGHIEAPTLRMAADAMETHIRAAHSLVMEREPRPMTVTPLSVLGILTLAVGTPAGMLAVIWIGGGLP